MLKKKKQHKYLAKRWHAVRSYLSDFADTSNPEVLHQLRVEVKKLKAFAVFTAKSGRHRKRALRPLRKMFRKAGVIREAGLTMALLKKHRISDPTLKAASQAVIERQTAAFCAHVAYYGRQAEKAVALLRKKRHAVTDGRVKRWFSAQLKRTAGLLAAPPPAQWHNARKKIKNMLYVYGMLPGDLAASLQLNEKYLQHLQEQIGNWHDAALASNLLPAAEGKTAQSRLHGEARKMQQTVQRSGRNFARRATTLPPEKPVSAYYSP